MAPQFPLHADLGFTALEQKDFRVCGLGLWYFLISTKIQGKKTTFLYSIFVLLSSVDFQREMIFKCSYAIILT